MQTFSDIRQIAQHGQPALALTFGNFDGVHQGHQQLLSHLKRVSQAANEALAVMSFVPHPRKILQSEVQRFLLGSYQQRRLWLEALGVEFLIEIPFTRDFSTLEAPTFLDTHVLSYPNLKSLYLGHDFAFGANKEGDALVVKEHCRSLSLKVEVCPVFQVNGAQVSSTLIRQALSRGEMEKAQTLLGRPFALQGVVVRGEGRGRKIGIPTANLHLDPDIIVPTRGVYVTESLFKGQVWRSVTNVGHNPTFEADKALTVETHLIDYNGDLYGETLEVRFITRLRDELRFPSVNDLIAQLHLDIAAGRDYPLP